VVLGLPALAFYVNGTRLFRGGTGEVVNTVHSALAAGPYWSYGTRWMLLQLTIAGAVVAAAAWATTFRRTPPPPPPVADRVPAAG
jgi:hypothetical protein